MKIQRRSLAKEIKAQRPLLFNQSGASSICPKMYSQQLNDYKNVESFIKLRQMKCNKSISLLNCSKQISRIDESINQVKSNTQVNSNNHNETRIIARQVIKDCIQKRKTKLNSADESFQNLYLLEEKSAQEYQSSLNKHIEDSKQFQSSISFNLEKLSRNQLYLKLKDLNKNLNANQKQELANQKQLNLIDITLRSTVEPSITDISPITICDDADNKIVKDKLKILISPQYHQQNHSKRQSTIPYFAKHSLNIRLNQINQKNQDSQNVTSTNTSNINSLMRNKSHLYSREIKRIHIHSES
ncbi:unnamed protein product [Paramecium sonneborni]|uniref:Uncharacterized protein n=1 Tax=Paramecium sonneborni TaxID=65129 RepID=A0A8S1MLG7_9CILI|nr:unnamed protein product [Paramecium sonneborni]